MPKSAQNFFTEEEEHQIISAIKKAEKNTSGEIRVHLDQSSEEEEFETAKKAFSELRMHETALRNGVLFHFSIQNKTFSVIADQGINNVVEKDFWKDITQQMQAQFTQKEFCKGLCQGIIQAGEALKQYFPFTDNDTNELPDEITTS